MIKLTRAEYDEVYKHIREVKRILDRKHFPCADLNKRRKQRINRMEFIIDLLELFNRID